MRLINEILRLVYDTILIQRDKLEEYNNKYEPQIIQEQDEYTLIYSRTNNHMVNSISAMIYLNYIDYLIKELVEYTSIYSQINELTLSFLSAMIYFNCTEHDEYTLIYSRINNHTMNYISAVIYVDYIDYLIMELVEYTSIYSQINEVAVSFLSAMIYFNCTYKGSFSTEYRTDMFKFTITHRLVNTSFFTKILIYKDQYRYRTS